MGFPVENFPIFNLFGYFLFVVLYTPFHREWNTRFGHSIPPCNFRPIDDLISWPCSSFLQKARNIHHVSNVAVVFLSIRAAVHFALVLPSIKKSLKGLALHFVRR
ncbi:hypothetical protein EMCRGX_G015331 [Ephydatia muelleri]